MALTPAQLLLIISAALSVMSLISLAINRVTPWTPFHLAFATMFFVSVLAVWPQIAGDILGRTQYNPIRTDVAATVLAGSVILGASTWFFRWQRFLPMPRPDEYPTGTCQLNVNIIGIVCLGLCVVAAYTSYKRLGNLTLIALGSDEPLAGDLTPAEAMSGAAIAIGRGAGRILPLLCVTEYVYCFPKFWGFVRRRFFLLGCTFLAMVLEVFDGQRTQIMLPAAGVIFALAIANRISKKWVAIAGCFAAVFFIIVGEFRSKDFTTLYQLKAGQTGIYAVDKPAIWLVTYSEPSIYNFNNLVRLHPRPTYGMSWFSQMAPGSILRKIGPVPKSVPEIMSDHDAYAQPGLTLRTSYADWYRDFGLFGAVVAVTITWSATVYAFNRCRLSPRYLWLYLTLSYGTANLAFLNHFIGIPFEMPLLLLPWMRGQRLVEVSDYDYAK